MFVQLVIYVIYLLYIFTVNFNSDCLMKSYKIIKNNNTYINFEKIKLDIKISKARINLDNLFGGDPVLGMLLLTWYYYI